MIELKTGVKIKTHEELGITFREWCSLFAVWGALAHNLLPYGPHDDTPRGTHTFNINISCQRNGECGTVACIGGNMALAMGMDIRDGWRFVEHGRIPGTGPREHRFRRLFYPLCISWERITPVVAAEAVWNFLRTGKPGWAGIAKHLALSGADEPLRYEPYKGRIKDHTKLHISFSEWLSLIGVRVMLDCGAIKMEPNAHGVTWAKTFLEYHPGEHVFNMASDMVSSSCGTVGCIGGYMGEMMGEREVSRYVRDQKYGSDKVLGPLFYPPDRYAWCTITAEQAVEAIDNFLTTGKPMWSQVLDGKRENAGK